MPSGARGQHDAALFDAHIFRPHNFIGLALLEKAIDMDSRAVGKSIASYYSFVGRDLDAEHVGHQPAGAVQLAGVHVRVHAEEIGARAQGHHHLFQRGVPGPLADSVDGAFHLAGAVQNAIQRVRHRHPQIVMAVHADGGPADIGHSLADRADQAAILLRHRVARGVGNVDHRGAGINGRLEHLKEVSWIGRGRHLPRRIPHRRHTAAPV